MTVFEMLRSIVLAAAAIGLAGCITSPPPEYCPPVVRADAATKAWLRKQDMPQPVLNWLDRIGKQQAAIEGTCGVD